MDREGIRALAQHLARVKLEAEGMSYRIIFHTNISPIKRAHEKLRAGLRAEQGIEKKDGGGEEIERNERFVT